MGLRGLAACWVMLGHYELGEWTGNAMKIDVPMRLGQAKQDGVAVILQGNDYGEVLAAAVMPVPSNYLVALPR